MSNETIYRARQFVKSHKTEIIIVGTGAVIITGIVIGARYQVKQLSELNHVKDIRIENLEKTCAVKDIKINNLEALCDKKDNVFKAVISDSLKHGSSEAGRHMAERKAYLNQMPA